MDAPNIFLAESSEQLQRAYPVVQELRPHLTLEAFCQQVTRQRAAGYQLACLEHASAIRSAAGFRITESLSWGKFMYVDDLVTRAADHGHGYGSRLLDWLVQQAKTHGCAQFHLDSGVQRFGAHRFYLHKGLDITCHHFGMKF